MLSAAASWVGKKPAKEIVTNFTASFTTEAEVSFLACLVSGTWSFHARVAFIYFPCKDRWDRVVVQAQYSMRSSAKLAMTSVVWFLNWVEHIHV